MRFQGFDEQVFRGAAKCALVLSLANPCLPHVHGAENGFLHHSRHCVIDELPQQITPPAKSAAISKASLQLYGIEGDRFWAS